MKYPQTKIKENKKHLGPTLSPTIAPSSSPSHFPINSPSTTPTDHPSAFPTQFPSKAPSTSPSYPPSYFHETSLNTFLNISHTLFAILAAFGIAIFLACVGGAFYIFRRCKARNRRIVGKEIVKTGKTPAENNKVKPTLPSSQSVKMGEKRASYRNLERTFAKSVTLGRKRSEEVVGDRSASPSPQGSTPSSVDDTLWMDGSSGTSGEEEPGSGGRGIFSVGVRGRNVELQLASILENAPHENNDRGGSVGSISVVTRVRGDIGSLTSVRSSSEQRGLSITSYNSHKEGAPPPIIMSPPRMSNLKTTFVEDLPDLPRGDTPLSTKNDIVLGNSPGYRE